MRVSAEEFDQLVLASRLREPELSCCVAIILGSERTKAVLDAAPTPTFVERVNG